MSRERAIQILRTYLRPAVEAAGYRWGARNDRHMAELVDLLATLADGEFGAELDDEETSAPREQSIEDADPRYAAWLRRRTA